MARPPLVHGARVEAHVTARPFTIDVKRFGVPFTIVCTCPECGREVRADLESHYLSYPEVGVPFRHGMYCSGYDEASDKDWEHEFEVELVMGITLSVPEGKAADG